jgi:5'/3'-nucleotidase
MFRSLPRKVSSLTAFCTAVSATCLLAVTAAQQPQRPYRILISNDDGIRAPALPILAQALKPIGELVIVAPADNQSGVSQGLTAAPPIARENLTLTGGLPAIGLTATPATTIQIAIKNIVMPRPDLVVTGINTAYNLGASAYLSGTVGAARQAVIEGVPAVATSMATPAVVRDLVPAAQQVAGVVRRLREHGLPAQTFLNVNIPPMPTGGYKGYQVTSQAAVRGGVERFVEGKRPGTDQTVYWSVYTEGASAPQGTDIWAVNNGYVSVTPMHVGEYDEKLAVTLRGWFK